MLGDPGIIQLQYFNLLNINKGIVLNVFVLLLIFSARHVFLECLQRDIPILLLAKL